jgi:hypothetical protein
VPGGMARLDAVSRKGDYDFISWPEIWYHWPRHVGDTVGGVSLKRADLFGPMHEVEARQSAERLREGAGLRWSDTPRIYHGCMARRVLTDIKVRTGQVFGYDVPDVSLWVAASLVSGRGVMLGHPVSLIGISPKSTGTSLLANTTDSTKAVPGAQFNTEVGLGDAAKWPFNPGILSVQYYIYCSLLMVTEQLGLTEPINHDSWMRQIIAQLSSEVSVHRLAKQAQALCPIDEVIIAAVRAIPELPAVSAQTAASKKRSVAKLLHKGRLLVDTAAQADNVLTATTALEVAGLAQSVDLQPFPAWQVTQLYRWAQVVRGNWSSMVP